jgi:hypothetical protein
MKKNNDKKKAKVFFCDGRPSKRISRLKKEKKSFEVSTTNRTTKIKETDCVYIYGAGSGLRFNQLGLFKELKKHVAEQIKDKQINVATKNYTDISYFKVSDRLVNMEAGEFIQNCLGFDVNMAYYKTAYNMGFIDRDFYEKCRYLDKDIRLKLIGSLATKKRMLVYKEGKAIDYSVKYDYVLRNVWFNIVDYVNNCLTEFAEMCKERFLFYWVDGIYLEGSAADYNDVLDFISNKYKLEFKKEGIEKIVMQIDESDSKYIAVYKTDMIGKVDENGKTKDNKPFYLKKERKVLYEITN